MVFPNTHGIIRPDGGQRYFQVEETRNGQYQIVASDRAAMIAAEEYRLHAAAVGRTMHSPERHQAAFATRLVMEDFPFHCYAPTGLEFSAECYARNLAALGFTGMECNRYSVMQPLEAFHRQYEFTNPSLAWFIRTQFHREIVKPELLERNFQELRHNMEIAAAYGLEAIVTTFLPRPYPEEFFRTYPHWRGEKYETAFMRAGGHPAEYRLNTDEPEVMEFYRQLFAGLLGSCPELRHIFLWHGDLGTGFPGMPGEERARRIGAFHHMLQREIAIAGLPVKVWLNPWHLGAGDVASLCRHLPSGVNFSVKDTPGLEFFAGSTPATLPDATIIRSELGEIPRQILRDAQTDQRGVCLGQYQDFSEDLDPVLGVPHPWSTFRKLQRLKTLSPEASAVHWGVLSPELVPVNINREVIREISWGNPATTLPELAPVIIPDCFDAQQREDILAAWLAVDDALALWPQFWSLRLQDSGIRLRWLFRPFGSDVPENPELREHQIYRVELADPYHSFSELTPEQVRECALFYSRMLSHIEEAICRMRQLPDPREYLKPQIASLQTLACFWRTYRNLLGFFGWRDGASTERRSEFMRKYIVDEIGNVNDTIVHLAQHPETILIAQRGEWGQCLGPNYAELLRVKLRCMQAAREMTDPGLLPGIV